MVDDTKLEIFWLLSSSSLSQSSQSVAAALMVSSLERMLVL
jgi:hypothetical protein